MQIDQRPESPWQGKRGSDGYLAQRALQGDGSAFEALVQRYSGPLFSFICHFLGDYDQACDILQQVFLQLYLSLPGLRLGVPLKPWLFQVARNRCLDELRRKRAATFSELENGSEEEELPVAVASLADGGPLPEELAERHDLQQLLLGAIQDLPPRFRAVVLLRYTAQLSFAEIGQVLSVPEATAKTYFQRSKPLLRAALSEQIRAGAPS
ncbi:RNA polymerase sigma factor [Thermogemmatispora sp.]|uniref:RNA polymerase sigma factor n=1 Tax=Thermogemmatispora sp. TaxID=1968838 RepID=UPI002ACC27E1|nr:sigma-70 family RNA polymerase sigma factor [Thermogemmatispora sp.]